MWLHVVCRTVFLPRKKDAILVLASTNKCTWSCEMDNSFQITNMNIIMFAGSEIFEYLSRMMGMPGPSLLIHSTHSITPSNCGNC